MKKTIISLCDLDLSHWSLSRCSQNHMNLLGEGRESEFPHRVWPTVLLQHKNIVLVSTPGKPETNQEHWEGNTKGQVSTCLLQICEAAQVPSSLCWVMYSEKHSTHCPLSFLLQISPNEAFSKKKTKNKSIWTANTEVLSPFSVALINILWYASFKQEILLWR